MDLISRQAAIDALAEWHDVAITNRLNNLPSAQQKKLKYSGESICVHCQTKDCDGCLFEPMEGVMNE